MLKLNLIMNNEDKYICYIGRPSYQKNTLFLIDVAYELCKLHPEVKFYILGVGYYAPGLEALRSKIETLKLQENVKLFPWLNHIDSLKYVQKSLLYLTVAKYEGLPLAVLEAMSLGKAIVASRVLGNIDCVLDNYNGRLLPLDVRKFVNTLSSLIDDNAKREQFGKNSRALFEKKFLINNRIQDLTDIYTHIGTKHEQRLSHIWSRASK